MIFLHGSGEKGTDIEKVKVHGPLKYSKDHELDSYILVPQCPENEYWNSEVLYQLILKIEKEINFEIIFTTSHDKYAINAIKNNAVDYLLKPIKEKELKQALSKVLKRLEEKETLQRAEQLQAYLDKIKSR